MYQILELQQTPHISPSRASHGVSIVGILQKTDLVIMAPHCTCLSESEAQLNEWEQYIKENLLCTMISPQQNKAQNVYI